MRKFLIISLIFSGFSAFAGSAKPQAIFLHSCFMMSGKNPYVETFLMVKGNSVQYRKNESGKFQAAIEVILTLSEGENIRFADKYKLLSPESDDSLGSNFNFIDQQRIPVPNGKYTLGIRIRDMLREGEAIEADVPVNVQFAADSINISDIQLISSYEKAEKPGPLYKGGYTLIQKSGEFFPAEEERLTFYAEVYRSLEKLGENQKYLLSWHVEDRKTGKRIEQYSGFRRFNTAMVNSALAEIDIRQLHSGDYWLLLEVRNQENIVQTSRKLPFTRYNPMQAASLESLVTVITEGSFAENYKNPDSLAEHIRCLSPISSPMERTFANNLLKDKNLQNMKQYFLTFWKNREPSEPSKAWEEYFSEVRKAQNTFGTAIKKGYNTDRGRVYLQYGPPDNRTVSLREPSAYPYEIWHYYRMKNQTNRRFVFYNPDLVTNDFSLIHSDALGEPQNDQWMFVIMKRDTQTNDIDADISDPHFGSQLRENFLTPR